MSRYIKIGMDQLLTFDTNSPYNESDQAALSLSAMLSWSNRWVINSLDYIPGEIHNKKDSMYYSWGIVD